MSRTRIVATYRLNADELIQCSMSIASNYPRRCSRSQGIRARHDARRELADVLAQTRTPADD